MGVTSVLKDHGTEFLDAIKENNFKSFKELCDKLLKYDDKISAFCISDIKHKQSKKFACPLIMAARLEDPSIINYMMEKSVDPNFIHRTVYTSRRKEMVTALHIAVDLTLFKTVAILLNANADPNIPDHNGESALMVAVKKSDWVMTQMLLSKGGDPSLIDSRGNAPLHVATLYGHLQLVKTLLKHDADAYQKGFMGAIPSHIAAREGHIHLIQVFCSRDIGNINIKIPCFHDAREKAPIHLAAEHGHVETVVALLDQFKADINLRDSNANTPLHCVVLNPYNAACMREKDYFYATAKILLKYRVRINEKNFHGNTALHLAARHRFQKIVELLLKVGANCFIENDHRQKPIDVVPENETVIRQLLKSAMSNPKQPLDISMLSLQNISFPVQTNASPHNDYRYKGNLNALPPHLSRNINSSRSISSLSSVFINNSSRHNPHQSHHHLNQNNRSKSSIMKQGIDPYRQHTKLRKKLSDESIYSSQDSLHNKSTLLQHGDTSRKIYSNSRNHKNEKNQYIKQRSASLERPFRLDKNKKDVDWYENLSFQSNQAPLATSERKISSKELNHSRDQNYSISRSHKSTNNEKVKHVTIPGKPRTIEVEYSSGPITIELETVQDHLQQNFNDDASYTSSENSNDRNSRREKENKHLRRQKIKHENKHKLEKEKSNSYETNFIDFKKTIEPKNNKSLNNISKKNHNKAKSNEKSEPIYMNNSKILAELHEKSGYLDENLEVDELLEEKFENNYSVKEHKSKNNSSKENISKKDWQKLRQQQFDEDRMLFEDPLDKDEPEKDFLLPSDIDTNLSTDDSDAFEDEKKRLRDLRRESLRKAIETTNSLKQRWSQDEDEEAIKYQHKNKINSKKKVIDELVKPPRPSLSLAEGTNNQEYNTKNYNSLEEKKFPVDKFESVLIENFNDNKIIKLQTLCYVKEPIIPFSSNSTIKTDAYILPSTDYIKQPNIGVSSSEEPLPEQIVSKPVKRLNIKVSGEVPKAYSRKDKNAARSAFIIHPPAKFESSSEASDADASSSINDQSPDRKEKYKGGVNSYTTFGVVEPNVCTLLDNDHNKENLNSNIIKNGKNKMKADNAIIEVELIEHNKYATFYPENYHIDSDESIDSLENESFEEYSDENYSMNRKRSSLRYAINNKKIKPRSQSKEKDYEYFNKALSNSLTSSIENIKESIKVPPNKSIRIKKENRKIVNNESNNNAFSFENSADAISFGDINSNIIDDNQNVSYGMDIVKIKTKKNKRKDLIISVEEEVVSTNFDEPLKVKKKNKKNKNYEMTDDSMEQILNDAKKMAKSIVDDNNYQMQDKMITKIKNSNSGVKNLDDVLPWTDDSQPLATSETYEFYKKKSKKSKVPFMKIVSTDEGENNDSFSFDITANESGEFLLDDNLLKIKNKNLSTIVTEELKKNLKTEENDLDMMIPHPDGPKWISGTRKPTNSTNLLDVEIPPSYQVNKQKKTRRRRQNIEMEKDNTEISADHLGPAKNRIIGRKQEKNSLKEVSSQSEAVISQNTLMAQGKDKKKVIHFEMDKDKDNRGFILPPPNAFNQSLNLNSRGRYGDSQLNNIKHGQNKFEYSSDVDPNINYESSLINANLKKNARRVLPRSITNLPRDYYDPGVVSEGEQVPLRRLNRQVHSEAETSDFETPRVPAPGVSYKQAALYYIHRPTRSFVMRQPGHHDKSFDYLRKLYKPRVYRSRSSHLYPTAGKYGEKEMRRVISSMSLNESQSDFDRSFIEMEEDTMDDITSELGLKQENPIYISLLKYRQLSKERKDLRIADDIPPVINEPGAIDFQLYGIIARIWMELVDKQTVSKSKTMYLSVLPKGQDLPQEIIRSARFQRNVSPSRQLEEGAPQWVVAKSRYLQKNIQISDNNSRIGSQLGDLSLGHQMILFFKVGEDWMELAWVLFDGLIPVADIVRMIKDIELKNHKSLANQVQDLMQRWWSKKGSEATVQQLQRALDLLHMMYVEEEYSRQDASSYFGQSSEDELEPKNMGYNDPIVTKLSKEYDKALSNADTLTKVEEVNTEMVIRQMQQSKTIPNAKNVFKVSTEVASDKSKLTNMEQRTTSVSDNNTSETIKSRRSKHETNL